MDSKTIPQLVHKQQLSPVFFTAFTAAAKEAAKIGEAVGTGDYPGLDAAWHLYTSPSHPNAAKLSALEKSNVEQLCITSRHQCAAGQTLEELLEQLQAVVSDEDKRVDAKAAASSIVSALQHLYIAIEHTNNMLGDLGQKWKHTTDQGELAADKSNCSKLVPKPVVQVKTDWRAGSVKQAVEIGGAAGTGDYPGFDRSWDHWINPNDSKLGSAARSYKSKKQAPQQQMAPAAAHARSAWRSGGGRPPATAPVAAVALVP
jgi:hypothetical protein